MIGSACVLHNLTLSGAEEFERYLHNNPEELIMELQRSNVRREFFNPGGINDAIDSIDLVHSHPDDVLAETRGRALRDGLTSRLREEGYDPEIHQIEHDYWWRRIAD